MIPMPALGDWMPVTLGWQPGGPWVDWCDFAGTRLTDSFFDHTAARLMANPCRNLFRPLTTLEECCRRLPEADSRPGGIIFHLSRSGSTLVSRMLGALPRQVMLSEPAPLDQLLALRRVVPGVADETWQRWLHGLLTVMGRRRRPTDDCWFVKCDARHVLDLPFITAAFPGVPWIFLYRDPVEVLVAQREMPAALMVPGGLVRGMEELSSPAGTAPEEHIARVLSLFCRAALDGAASPDGLLLNYHQLPGEALPLLIRHFRLQSGDSSRMLAAARSNAKSPLHPFQSDAGAKQSRATAADHAAVRRWFGGMIGELETVRRASQARYSPP